MIDDWVNNLQKMQIRDIDMLSAVLYSEKRTRYMRYSSPYYEALDFFFIRDDLDVKTFSDLNGKRVAIAREFAHVELLKKHFPKIRIVTVNSFEDSIDAVLENRADILYDSYAALSYILKKKGISSIVPFKSTRQFGSNPVHFATHKNQPILADIIERALNAVTYYERTQIFNRWIQQYPNKHDFLLSLSSQEIAWLKQHPTITIGCEANWPPFEFIDQSDEMKGFSADLINLLAQRLHIQFQLQPYANWTETLTKLKHHDIDLVASIIKNKQREQYLSFSDPYITPSIVIYRRKNSPPIHTIDDLNLQTISVENNYYVSERLKQDYPQIRLFEVDTTAEALKALSHGRVDAYIGVQGPANAIIEQNALTNIRIVGDAGLGKAELRFAVRNDWPVFVSILNKALNSIPPPEMLALRHKWLNINEIQSNFQLSPEQQQWLNQHQQLRFAGDPNWLPYEGFDQQGNYIGIVAEYLQHIEKRLGISIQRVKTKSWTETVNMASRGDIDIISETVDSPLNAQFNFSRTFLNSPVVMIMRDSQTYVENIHQISDKTIALISQYGYTPTIMKEYPGIDFTLVDTIQDGLTQVSTGKIDALLATLAQSSFHIAELGINNIRIVGKTEFTTRLAFGVRKDHQPLLTMFNQALTDISPLRKQRITEKWGNPKFAAKPDYTLLALIAGTLIILNVFFYFWNRKLSTEIKKRKASELQVRLLNQRLALATKLVSLGVWQWDPDADNSFIFDERMFEMYGLPKQALVSYSEWINTVHPDDVATIEHGLQTLKDSGGEQQLEFRIRHADGSLRHIYAGGTISRDAHSGNNRIYGVNWDITRQKQSETQFREIIATLPLAIVITNNHGEILLENPHAVQELGNNTSILGRNAAEFYDHSKHNREVLKKLIKQRRINGEQVKYKVSATQSIDCLLSVLPIHYQNQNVWLVVMINLSERIKIEQRLAEAMQQAEHANKAKSEFLANMSHEIRTPMNAIIGFTELLENKLNDPQLSSYVKTIRSASTTLMSLINDILDLSKIEAGKMQIQHSQTDLQELIEDIMDIFTVSAANKQLELTVAIDSSVSGVDFLIDPVRLRQVLFNLVGNAIKFTESGYVRLEISSRNQDTAHQTQDLVITVEDSGIGIAEDQIEEVFSKFTQSQQLHHQNYKGTGLGLAISRRLTALMGGDLTVSSKPGHGSTFTVVLKQVQFCVEQKRIQQADQPNHTGDIEFKPALILIVDDIDNNRQLIKEILRDTPIKTIEADNGKDAVQITQQHTFDLILMDIRMPVMNGHDAAQHIKLIHTVPIIALTASKMADKALNFDGYIQKPVTRSALIETLCHFLDHSLTNPAHEDTIKLELNKQQLEQLPALLIELNRQLETWQTIRNNNNMSEISRFANTIYQHAAAYQCIPVQNYAQRLNEAVNQFDIQAITHHLNQFENVLIELEALNNQQQTTSKPVSSQTDQTI